MSKNDNAPAHTATCVLYPPLLASPYVPHHIKARLNNESEQIEGKLAFLVPYIIIQVLKCFEFRMALEIYKDTQNIMHKYIRYSYRYCCKDQIVRSQHTYVGHMPVR